MHNLQKQFNLYAVSKCRDWGGCDQSLNNNNKTFFNKSPVTSIMHNLQKQFNLYVVSKCPDWGGCDESLSNNNKTKV